MDIYILKGFEQFINLIEDGIIKVSIKVAIYTNEKYYGKTYNHSCGFAIEEHNLPKLYNIIEKNKKIRNT